MGCRLSGNNTVSEVHAGTTAEMAGLRVGWLVKSINGKPTAGREGLAVAVLQDLIKQSVFKLVFELDEQPPKAKPAAANATAAAKAVAAKATAAVKRTEQMPSPEAPKAKTAKAAKSTKPEQKAAIVSCPWSEISPHLYQMKHDKLVRLIEGAWESGEDLRTVFSNACSSSWARAPRQEQMLEHNWECKDFDVSPLLFKNGEESRLISAYDGDFEVIAKQSDITPSGVYFDDGHGGCQECCGGEEFHVWLEVNRAGGMRVKVKAEAYDSCHRRSREVFETTTTIYYPAPHLDE